MELAYRSVRAGASALLIALAVGAGGMTGMTSVLAADPATVALNGTVVDAEGAPLAGISLTISEELGPDGGLAAFQATTSADGTFAADVYAWGTAAAPASLSIATAAESSVAVEGDGCSRTWSVAVQDQRDVAFADAAPSPLVLTATTELLGEVCGTTGTPGSGTGGGNGTNSGSGGTAGLTPPPTDVQRATAAPPDRIAPALTVGFLAGLVFAAVVILPRRRSHRS